MEERTNRRGFKYHAVAGRHLKLNELKEVARTSGVHNNYLFKEDILDYPRPEFHVCRLSHDTDGDGLWGIRREEGFMNLWGEGFVWWSLDVGPEERASAERRLLETTYPDRTEEQIQMQQSLLSKFASSPVLLSSSRLGSFRFTFPLKEVIRAYKEQFCGGAEPEMRVFETHLYRQEVMYAVLVHSPANQEQFNKYPLLTEDPDAVCCYRDGYFLWRPEAMCETHEYELVRRDSLKQLEARRCCGKPRFYVWDNVTIAFHVDDQVLRFNVVRLRNSLSFCERGSVVTNRETVFHDYPTADQIVGQLWPDCPYPLWRGEEQEETATGHQDVYYPHRPFMFPYPQY
ncbi:uncharacterized protein LOC121519021 [Cheilinus undulatus]|uniref:uncharacterized protein LOC121519021 n=1 Tax=Cheilinus undulatus TaxID=241271 RepID=UPI001BD6472C|nr:uncharacterized protein LOC121519021 [Cheilinus undulatus]